MDLKNFRRAGRYCFTFQPTAVSRLRNIRKIVSLSIDDILYLPAKTFHFLDGYELGGLATSVKRDGTESGISIRGKSTATVKEPHCLYPGDLYPYTRRPLFIIIDSDNSFVFAHIPKYFGQPLVILMSPQDVPQNFQGKGLYRKIFHWDI